MTRVPSIVVPGHPHHVIQRGNRLSGTATRGEVDLTLREPPASGLTLVRAEIQLRWTAAPWLNFRGSKLPQKFKPGFS